MIIYSVEISIKKECCNEWVIWMKNNHIPDVMKTGLFIDYTFFKNLHTHHTYTIQYKLESIEKYFQYQEVFATDLQKAHNQNFKNNFSAKRNLFTDL